MARAKESEAAFQRQTKQYLDRALNANEVVWFHPPNGAHLASGQAGNLLSQGMLPGVADWVIAWPGGVLFIELKTAKTKQNDAQLAFAHRCDKAGVTYRLVRNLTEFELALGAAGVPMRGRLAA